MQHIFLLPVGQVAGILAHVVTLPNFKDWSLPRISPDNPPCMEKQNLPEFHFLIPMMKSLAGSDVFNAACITKETFCQVLLMRFKVAVDFM
jgi:hypothetical protein